MCIVPQRVNALWDFADYYILQKCVINESSSKYSGFLFCLGVFVPIENFHSYGDVTITGEGLQCLTYAWHLWPLSRQGSLASHSCFDKGIRS